MDMSDEVHDVVTTMKLSAKENEGSIGCVRNSPKQDFWVVRGTEDLIDVGRINFCNDETWLYESPMRNLEIKDLKSWLYQGTGNLKDIDFHSARLSLVREIANLETRKSIDSRTFTRPKKRLSRPSIEHYNEGYFRMNKNASFEENDQSLNATMHPGKVIESNEAQVENGGDPDRRHETKPQIPLSFDYSQPTTSSIFEKIASASEVDSFQNMSPPSLVNSMCSSTFANLMENSYIKNDPTLREIRDAEPTEAMLQDYEPPIFKSFTDSCSSIGSDIPENFLNRTNESSLHKVHQKNVINENEDSLNKTYTTDDVTILDCTYSKDTSSDANNTVILRPKNETIKQAPILNREADHTNSTDTVDISNDTPPSILNATFRKNASAKLGETFRKSPRSRSDELLNEDLNKTIIIVDGIDSNRLSSPKRRSCILDNRKSESNCTTNLKRNSFGFSAGSSDSLDYTSSLSNSSKGSNKMLNMAEVDAIVLQQEQSLQVNSTPKPSSKIVSKLWENNCISPIVPLDRGDVLSDSDASSADDYRTVTSNVSNIKTPFGSETYMLKSNSSLENFNRNPELMQPNPKSLNAIPTKTATNSKKYDNRFRGSYSNLKAVGNNLKGSYTNLRATDAYTKNSCSNIARGGSNTKGSTTNLKTMSNNLKGSYTQLKPVLTNLPCADSNLKMYNPNSTITLSKQPVNLRPNKGSESCLKIAEVAPTLRDIPPKAQVKSASSVNCIARPALKASGLPRPVSSIPRAMGSRIPCPRNDRVTSQRHPVSKVNFDGDF